MSDATDEAAAPLDESPAQRQARLRRERRQAKVASGGKDRLQAIASLSGRTMAQLDEAAAAANPTQQPSVTDDPEEVDISQPYAGQPIASQASRNINPATAPGLQEPNDPIMRMMQQMMMGEQSGPNGPNQQENDPMMRMMQQMMSGAGVNQQGSQQAPTTNEGYIWRIVHAIFALGLALYIALTSTFNGSKLSRSVSVSTNELDGGVTQRLFWIFVTSELGLQGTRYVVEKGRLPESGWLGMIGGILPEPYKGYVAIIARYGIIWTTVVSDAMVVIFVLGVLAWWKGEAVV
ncbi:MAG: hypothetical protein M1820_001480 [Bogoriella megaspora]|nr:MAG: hypothetical protein M1820_001480 [Bogoriella megaspora]